MELRYKRAISRCAMLMALTLPGTPAMSHEHVRLGSEILVEQELHLLRKKRVGLITNHTGRLSTNEFLVDALLAKGVNVVALFGPEHGIRGEAAAGESVADTKDDKTGIPVFSLYGQTKKPTAEMLANIDVLVYDIQDVGVRFYTYISTMGLCMEAAAEKGIPFIVLDRPNPLGGLKIDGPILEDSLKSFVGMYPIPVVYGLTCGELATMINEEGWLANRARCTLTVIKMAGWKRTMTWDETGLPWIPPSPNIKTVQTALIYPATCYFEATNISEGRGTMQPFQFIGAARSVQAESAFTRWEGILNAAQLGGLRWRRIFFTPSFSKLNGRECVGLELTVADWNRFQPATSGLFLLQQLKRILPSLTIHDRPLLRLIGSRAALDIVYSNETIAQMENRWSKSLIEFQNRVQQYRLYR